MKLFLLILTGLSAVVYGISLGEDFLPGKGWKILGVSLGLVLFTTGLALGKKGSAFRWGLALGLPGLLLGSWLLARLDIGRASADCERNMDRLRADLIQYRKQHGNFPLFLDLLGWPQLPGNRVLGPSVLHYDFGLTSFRLYVSTEKRRVPWTSCSIPRKK